MQHCDQGRFYSPCMWICRCLKAVEVATSGWESEEHSHAVHMIRICLLYCPLMLTFNYLRGTYFGIRAANASSGVFQLLGFWLCSGAWVWDLPCSVSYSSRMSLAWVLMLQSPKHHPRLPRFIVKVSREIFKAFKILQFWRDFCWKKCWQMTTKLTPLDHVLLQEENATKLSNSFLKFRPISMKKGSE